MQLHNILSAVIDVGARARAVWDCIPGANLRDANLQICIGRLGRYRAYPLYLVCAVISFCLPLGLCGCLGGQIIAPHATTTANTGSLQAAPNIVSFGSVSLGTTASASVSLVNQGSAAVQVSQISLAGQSFSLNGGGALPITLAAGGTLNLSVNFSPATLGAATGELVITSDAAPTGTLSVELVGTGTAASAPNLPELSSLNCVSSAVTGSATDMCTVSLNADAPIGGITVDLASNNSSVTVPASVTVAAGANGSSFTASVSPVSSAQTATLTASAGGVAEAFALQLNAVTSGQSAAAIPELSGLSCAVASISGAGIDSCTITLNSMVPNGGFSVNLASNNPAVAVPPSVIVAAGSNSASFTAGVSPVASAQTATVAASAGGVTEEFSVQLNVGVTGLSINTTSIAFGNVPVNATMTQSVELTASGPLPITVAAATIQGAGFSMTGATFPLTLAVGESATIEVTFDPATAGSSTGQMLIASTAITSGTAVVSLSGTGELIEVNLTWDAPTSSPDPVAGYNVYRALSGSYSYQQINPSIVTQTSYVDLTVGAGQTYDYIVESVDASGVTSAPSNMASATLP